MLGDDIRSAVRSVSRARTLTTVLLISLGLGTGANAAVYGVVHALLFRAPAGMADASTLASIYTTQYDGRKFGPSSWSDVLSVAEGTDSFETLAAMDDRTVANVRVAEYFRATRVAAVSSDFFGVIRMRPHAGRLLHAGDATAATPTAVISSSRLTSSSSGCPGRWPTVFRRPIAARRHSLRRLAGCRRSRIRRSNQSRVSRSR